MNFRIANIFLSLALLLTISSKAVSQWVPTIGLNDAKVNCLITKGTGLFAGTSNGVYISVDTGTTWNPVSSGLPIFDLKGITALTSSQTTPTSIAISMT